MKICILLRRKQLKMKTTNTIAQVREESRDLYETNGLIPFIVLHKDHGVTRARYGINFLRPDTALNSTYPAISGGGYMTVVEPLHVDTEAYPKTYTTSIAREAGTVTATEEVAPYKSDDFAQWIKVTFVALGKTWTGSARILGIKSDAEARALLQIKQAIQRVKSLTA